MPVSAWHGHARLKLKPHCFPPRYLVLDAQGFVVHDVAMLEKQTKSTLEYTYNGKQLIIDFKRALRVGEASWWQLLILPDRTNYQDVRRAA
jgi:hypothetical protein